MAVVKRVLIKVVLPSPDSPVDYGERVMGELDAMRTWSGRVRMLTDAGHVPHTIKVKLAPRLATIL